MGKHHIKINFIAKALVFICIFNCLNIAFVNTPVKADVWVTPNIYGNKSTSVTVYANGNNTWVNDSNSATCYADLNNAVGNIEVTITGSGSSNASSSDSTVYSYSYSASANFNGVTKTNSGNSIVINVGNNPVSGTLAITVTANAGVRRFSTSAYTTSSCSVVSVKYQQQQQIAPTMSLSPTNGGTVYYSKNTALSLTCPVPSTTGTPTPTVTYSWSGTGVSNATSRTCSVAATTDPNAYKDKTYTCTVTATNKVGTKTTTYSVTLQPDMTTFDPSFNSSLS